MNETRLQLDVPRLKTIAMLEGVPLTFLDLETTTLPNRPTFGITEMGAMHIYPNGDITQLGSLINPENPIDPEAGRITGITEDMVRGQPHWGDLGRDLTHDWGKQNIVMGFNSISFDLPAIVQQNNRYGLADTVFCRQKDVRSFWRLISGTAKGRLTEIAEQYQIVNDGAHRAMIDVIMSALILEKFLEIHGLDFFDHPGGAMSPNKKIEAAFLSPEHTGGRFVTKADHVLTKIADAPFQGLKELSLRTGIEEFELGFLLGDLLVEGKAEPAYFAISAAQDYLKDSVPGIVEDAWHGDARGKLKPIMDRLPKSIRVDYLQLRVYLVQAGYFAALDKAHEPNVPDAVSSAPQP